jgi:hypothetical protein
LGSLDERKSHDTLPSICFTSQIQTDDLVPRTGYQDVAFESDYWEILSERRLLLLQRILQVERPIAHTQPH